MILEVETNTRKIDKRLDTGLAKLLWVTDTRALEDERRTQSTTGDDDLLASPDGPRHLLVGVERLGRNTLDGNSAVTLENDLVNLVAGEKVQVLVNSASAVNVAVSRVGSSSSIAVDPLEPVLGTMAGGQVLKIVGGWDTLRFGGAKEVLLDWVGVVTERDLDGSLESVDVAVVARTLVGLVLLHQGDELLGGPSLGLEVIVVGSRGTGVHLIHDQQWLIMVRF
jgi:hypothetical protein